MSNKYGHRSYNWFEAIVNKLGGEEAAEAFLRGELIVRAAERVFLTWKTVKLGTGLKSADDFREALRQAGCQISDRGNDILGQPAFAASLAKEETDLDLVLVSVADLGFKNGATRDQIYAQARELGLETVPPEVGPQLRLQYKDQPLNEWILVAMEPVADSDGRLRVFSVELDDSGLWLYGAEGRPGCFWSGDCRWVFRRK